MWDVIAAESWEELQRDGVLRMTPEDCDIVPGEPHCQAMDETYGWFAEQLGQRVGPPPEGASLPYELYGLRKPDMRSTCFDGMADEVVRLRLEVPDEQVVLFDDDAWVLALNLAPVFWRMEDFDAFDTELAAAGYDYESRWDAEAGRAARAYIRRTWDRIFTLEDTREDVPPFVAGMVWELCLDWVRSAERFKPRKARDWTPRRS